MEVFNLKGTEATPSIILDHTTGVFEISGRSLPEDASTFYQPMLDWIDKYAEKPQSKTVLIFKLEYFNTTSSKLILSLLNKLEEIHNNESNVHISWYYHEDDIDTKDAGEEFADLYDFPFSFGTY